MHSRPSPCAHVKSRHKQTSCGAGFLFLPLELLPFFRFCDSRVLFFNVCCFRVPALPALASFQLLIRVFWYESICCRMCPTAPDCPFVELFPLHSLPCFPPSIVPSFHTGVSEMHFAPTHCATLPQTNDACTMRVEMIVHLNVNFVILYCIKQKRRRRMPLNQKAINNRC